MAKLHNIGPTSASFAKGLMSKVKVKLPKSKPVKLRFKPLGVK